MRTRDIFSIALTLGAGLISLSAQAATVKLAAETNEIFTDVCSTCHMQYVNAAGTAADADAIAAELPEILRRLDPKTPEDQQMPPSYAPIQLTSAQKSRLIKDLQRLK